MCISENWNTGQTGWFIFLNIEQNSLEWDFYFCWWLIKALFLICYDIMTTSIKTESMYINIWIKKKTYLEKVSTFVFINSIIYNVCFTAFRNIYFTVERGTWFILWTLITYLISNQTQEQQLKKKMTKLQFKNNFLIWLSSKSKVINIGKC